MNVLDPFEVADVEVYPLFDLETALPGESKSALEQRRKAVLGAAEYAVFQKVLKASALGAVLNEKDIGKSKHKVTLPLIYALETADAEQAIIAAELKPLDDHRGSAAYRIAMAKSLLAKFWFEQSEPTE